MGDRWDKHRTGERYQQLQRVKAGEAMGERVKDTLMVPQPLLGEIISGEIDSGETLAGESPLERIRDLIADLREELDMHRRFSRAWRRVAERYGLVNETHEELARVVEEENRDGDR